MTKITKQTEILAVLDRTVGDRPAITRREMADLLYMLQVEQLVELGNQWGGSDPDAPASTNAAAWTKTCRGINVVSVLADEDAPGARLASSNPGSIRYDQPGSMHPEMFATLMFCPRGCTDSEGGYDYLRRNCERLLIVED